MPKFQMINREKGQSLFEVVLALAVITLIIVGVVILATNAIRNTDFSRDKTLANRYAQQAMEWLRQERDADFGVFKTKVLIGPRCFMAVGDWNLLGVCTTGQEIAGTKFRREGNFSVVSTGKTEITTTIRVYWQDSGGDHEVRTVTKFTDWREQ